jgi:hypothetical protein
MSKASVMTKVTKQLPLKYTSAATAEHVKLFETRAWILDLFWRAYHFSIEIRCHSIQGCLKRELGFWICSGYDSMDIRNT